MSIYHRGVINNKVFPELGQISDRIKMHITTGIGLQVKSKHMRSQTRSIFVYVTDVFIFELGSRQEQIL